MQAILPKVSASFDCVKTLNTQVSRFGVSDIIREPPFSDPLLGNNLSKIIYKLALFECSSQLRSVPK